MRLCGWLEVRGGDNSLLQFILWQFAFKYLSNFEFSWAELRFLWFYCLYFTFTCRPYLLIEIHLFKRQCPKALRLFCMSDTISVMFHWVLHYVKAHTQNYCMYCGLWIFFCLPSSAFLKKYIYIFFFGGYEELKNPSSCFGSFAPMHCFILFFLLSCKMLQRI